MLKFFFFINIASSNVTCKVCCFKVTAFAINIMARSQNPLTGQMSGSMGNFVTSTLGSQNIVRAKSFNRRDPKTEAQVKQREGFKLISELFPLLGSIPEEGFVQRTSENSAYAVYMGANLSGAVDKSGDVAAIDYAKLMVSDGTMTMPVVKAVALNEEGVTITYLAQLRNMNNFATDEMVAIALMKTGELWIERQPRGDTATATVLLSVTDVTADDFRGVYLFAKRADGSKTSKSVYVGLQ